MEQSIGPNKPCWCGSGKKYKKCHLGRTEKSSRQAWEADKELHRYYGAERCMAPASLKEFCSDAIVRAHTVPKSGSLQRIAVNGHVYAFIPGVQRIVRGNGVLTPELYGINRASTFTGFCSYHDNTIFAPIEDSLFNFTNQQCFLLAYRAMAREHFLKQAQLGSMELLQGGNQDDFQQVLASAGNIGASIGMKDLERHKKNYDEVLLSGDFSKVRSYVMTFNQAPPVMCSGGIFPYESFDGTTAQDLEDRNKPADAIHFTSFYTGDVGAVIFTWLPDSDKACNYFISSLQKIADSDLSGTLLRFFFEYCENVQIAPKWWDAISQTAKNSLVRRLPSVANLALEWPKDRLLDDGIFFDDWGVLRRCREKQAQTSPTAGSSTND